MTAWNAGHSDIGVHADFTILLNFQGGEQPRVIILRRNLSDKVHTLHFSKEVTGWHESSVSLKRILWFLEKMNSAVEAAVDSSVAPEPGVHHRLMR